MTHEEQKGRLLSDGDISDMSHRDWFTNSDDWRRGGRDVRDFYEAKITSGNLRVVKKVDVKDTMCVGCSFDFLYADLWDFVDQWVDERIKHCPGCGNPIKR